MENKLFKGILLILSGLALLFFFLYDINDKKAVETVNTLPNRIFAIIGGIMLIISGIYFLFLYYNE